MTDHPIVRLMSLPTTIHGFCYHDDDGESYVILNSRDTWEQNLRTLAHEEKHIFNGEMYDPGYDEYGN